MADKNIDTLSIGLSLDISSFDENTKKALHNIEQIDASVKSAGRSMSNSLKDSTGSSEKLGSSFKSTKSSSNEMGDSFKATSLKIAAAIKIIETVIKVLGKVANMFHQCVEEANQQYVALTKLNTVLGNIYGATNQYTKALDNYLDKMEKAGVVSADALEQAAQVLATYTTSLKQVEDLIPAVADLSAALYGTNATAQNVQGLASAIGRALEGSEDALTRYGVKISEGTKKILSDESISKAEKVKAIVSDIEKSVGGMNETLGKTYAGQITQIRAYLGDIKENIGYIFENFVTPFLPVIKQWVINIKEFSDVVVEISKQITGIDSTSLTNVGEGFAKGLTDASTEADKLTGKLLGFDKFNSLDSGSDKETEKVDTSYISDLLNKGDDSVNLANKAKKIIEELNIPKIIEGIQNSLKPLGTLAKGIYDMFAVIFSESASDMSAWSADLANLWAYVNKTAETISSVLKDVGDLLVYVIGLVNDLVGALFSGEGTTERFGSAFDNLARIVNGLFTIVKNVVDIIKPILEPILSFVGKATSGFANLTTRVLNTLITNINKILNLLIPITKLISSLLASGLDSLLEIVSNTLNTIFGVLGDIFDLSGTELDAYVPMLNDIVSLITDLLEPSIESVKIVLSSLSDSFKDSFDTMKNITKDFVDIVKGLLTGDLGLVFKGVGNIFVDVLNGVCNGFKDFMDWIVNALNNSIGWLNKIITSFGGDPIGIPNTDKWGWKRDPIPRFENGGLPDKGSLFVANENGPELVGNIGGENAVANNRMIVEAIEQAAYNGFTRALRETGGSNITISIDSSEVDDSSFVRAIMPALKTEVKREGGDDSVLGR